VAAPGPLPPVLNIAGGTARPVRAVAEALIAAAGFRGELDEDGAGSSRSAAVPWQEADVSLARKALDWSPRRSLATSVTDLWTEVLDRPEECAR
ncbi:NarL family transcriptional regulator, partial [Streptosporangium nondiastaticum]